MSSKHSELKEEGLFQIKKSWWKRPFPWVAVGIALAGAGTYGGVRYHSQGSAASAVRVRYVQTATGNVAQTVSISGTLQPVNQTTISASGTLKSVSVKVGQKVKKGQVIAHLDTSSLELSLEQAKAQLSSAQAKLEQANTPTTTTIKGKTQTTQPNPNVVAQDEASVNQAKANLVSIENQIAACTVKSPISGTVMTVVNPNSTTTSTTTSTNSSGKSSGGSSNTIATITDLSSSDFEVQANVAQADVTGVHVGQTATISLSSTGGTTVTGKVESVTLIPETSSGVTTYPVVIKVNKPAKSGVTLLPGASVSVQVTEKQAKNVVTLPTAALTQQRGQIGVYENATGNSTATSNSASSAGSANSGGAGTASHRTKNLPAGLQFHPVTVGLYGGNTVQIKSGLTAGQKVAMVLPAASKSSSSNSGSTGARGGGISGGFARVSGGSGFGGGFSGGHNFGGRSGGGKG